MSSEEYIIAFCTCPDKQTASTIAKNLVQEKIVACVNILPNIISVYTWQDTIESSDESLLIIKSTAKKYNLIQDFIKANHPYDCPEVIAFTIDKGIPEYLKWITAVTT